MFYNGKVHNWNNFFKDVILIFELSPYLKRKIEKTVAK